jgi:hypothetical protein
MDKKKPIPNASHHVGRFAHPFFTAVPPSGRKPVNGFTRMTDWSKQQIGPVPPPAHGGTMTLSDVIGDAGKAEIEATGEFRFHALGDSGVGHADEAEKVSDEMSGDYTPTGGGLNPAFLFHLGDVIYGPGKEAHYTERFFRPYRRYPGKIIAIPGNHDGEVHSADDKPSLKAFQANFCMSQAGVPVAASSAGIYREMAAQPGVYWMLDAPFVRIIGLYSNLLENPGYLQGKNNGQGDTSQLDWLKQTLRSIREQPRKALVIATHHPPYSSAGHTGSQEMNDDVTRICTAPDIGVLPDLFLSAHAHNYQRYTRTLNGKKITYIVVGTGGMPPQPVPEATGQPTNVGHEVTYDGALSSLGYLYVTITRSEIRTQFWPLGGPSTPLDPTSIQL